jgi:hypothetical protein
MRSGPLWMYLRAGYRPPGGTSTELGPRRKPGAGRHRLYAPKSYSSSGIPSPFAAFGWPNGYPTAES